MEVLELVLRRDGTVKSFKSDFKIYRGSYGDVLFNISVPHELLVDQVRDIDTNDIITGNYVAVSAIIRTVVGKNLQTKKYYFKAVKDYEMHGTTHRLYQRKLPKEFTLWETVNQHEAIGGGLLEMIVNVVNFTTDDEKSRIEEIVASPILTLDIYPSDKLDEEEEIEPSEFEQLHSQVEDLQLDYDNTHSKADEALEKANTANDKSSQAVATANDAKTTAEGIEDIAINAEHKADNAEYVATQAKDDANIAITRANEAYDYADMAYLEAINADVKAEQAIDNSQYVDVRVNNLIEITNNRFSNVEEQLYDKLNAKPDGVNDLIDHNYKIEMDYIPDSIIGQVEYMGTWNAATNTPKLTVTPQEKGHYYVTKTAGAQFGITFEVGDWIISNGDEWEKVDNTDAVQSVAGRTGHIVLKKEDVGLSNVDNTSDINKPISLAQQTALNTKVNNTDFNDHKNNTNNPHGVTKEQLGLGSVTNNEQATKTEFNTHNNDNTRHITSAERTAWNAKANDNVVLKKTAQTLSTYEQEQVKLNLNIIDTTIDIQQTTGQSTTAVMSQKAVTDAIQTAIPNTLKDPDKTYLVIKTPADNDTFTLLTGTTGAPNYTIEWGDGTSDDITGTANPTHLYEKAGMYLITISGNFSNGIVVGTSANVNKDKMIDVYGGSNYPTSLVNYAFRSCPNLTTAIFPSATSLEFNAFNGCSNLNTVIFPNVTSIGSRAFQSCTILTTATLPNVITIVNYAFQECSSLATAIFPNATSIGDYGFYNCTNLKTLTLGNVTTTGAGTRFENVKLINLTIAQDVDATDIDRIKTFYADNGGTFTGAQINSIE